MKTNLSLKELIKGTVRFEYYRAGDLYYSTSADSNFVFPVPVKDVGDATFLKEDKAILFMRYIRKFISALEEK